MLGPLKRYRSLGAKCAVLWLLSLCSLAARGAAPQVDLSVSIAVSPEIFFPGGRSTVTVTANNAGPDAAGTTTATPSVVVYGGYYVVTTQPPPYEVIFPANGCNVERFETEPLPDGSIVLFFIYYFAAIPASQSRSCTFDIQFDPSTQTSFGTQWRIRSQDNDINLSNNMLSTTFVVAPPEPVPTLSPIGGLVLGLGLLATLGITRRRKFE